MNIDTLSNVNFSAVPRGQVTVAKRSCLYKTFNENGSVKGIKLIGYKPEELDLVELYKEEPDDNWTLKMLTALWGKNTVIRNIFNTYSAMGEDSIYCLTTQKKNFDKLNPYKVLGLLQVQDSVDYDRIEIVRLQTKPSQKYKSWFKSIPFLNNACQYLRKYHCIGKGLKDYAYDELSDGRMLELFPSKKAIPFYRKCGLEDGGDGWMFQM